MSSASDDRSFFVAMLLYGNDPEPMTVSDAAISIQEWILEGIEIPAGLTPEYLADTWNRYIRF